VPYIDLPNCPRNLDALFAHQQQILSSEHFKHFTSSKELRGKVKGWFSDIHVITKGRIPYKEFGSAWVGHQDNGVKQLFVKTRRLQQLEGDRDLIGYDGHRDAMCKFLHKYYGVEGKSIRSITANTCDVDHVVPLSWLLKRITLLKGRVSAAALHTTLSPFDAEQAQGATAFTHLIS